MKGGSQRKDMIPKSQTRLPSMRTKLRKISSDVSSVHPWERPSTFRYRFWRFQRTFTIHFAVTSAVKAGIPNLLWVYWGKLPPCLSKMQALLFFPTTRKIGLRDKLRLKNMSLQKWRRSNKSSFKESMVLQNSNDNKWALANSLKKSHLN